VFRVVDDKGNEVPRGKMGNIVLGLPLAPTAFRTLWEDEERFYKGYLKRFGGKWIDTGDAGWIDEKGYIHIMARTGMLLSQGRGSLENSTNIPKMTSSMLLPTVSAPVVLSRPSLATRW